MQAELAQQRDRAQDREAVAVEVVDQPEDLLTLALQVRVVELAVARMQLHVEGLLLLGGEIRGHQLLRAALEQRLDPAPQACEPLAVAAALDRPRVLLGEPLRVGEQPGRGDRQQRPQLHQVVLHRRSRDRQLERRGQLADAAVGLRLVVLDVLRLVEDQPRPGHRAVGVRLEPEQRVRRDHDVGGGDLLDRAPRPRQRVGDRIDLQSGREAGRLRHPVRHDARRRDHQERADARVALAGVADQRERLQRLAEPHVVGEDPAELELPQRRQPAEPVALVGAQLRLQRRRRVVLGDRIELEQRADLALPRLRLLASRRRARRARPTARPDSG